MKAIILKKTDEQIDCDKTNINQQIEDFFDDPNNYDVKEFTDDTSMFQIIYDSLGTPSVGVTACNIWENRDIVYVGYFIDIAEVLNYGTSDDSEEKILDKINEAYAQTKLNNFGSQLTAQHVTSNLIIVKNKLSYEINDNNVKTTMKPVSLSIEDLKDIIEITFIKNGLVIDINGDISEYKYIMNPIEHLMLTDKDFKDNYIYHEFEVYTHVMMVIVDVRENKNGSINEYASMLAGQIVKGRVFIAMYKKPEYNETPPYASINLERLKKIYKIRKISPTLTTGMSRSEREYINFDKILELECDKHKDKQELSISDLKGNCLNNKKE